MRIPDDDTGYELDDPKHPTYRERMADWADLKPRPHRTCPECGAPAFVAHHDDCRWSYQNTRSKLPAKEATVNETPEPQPVPTPDDPEPDDGDEE